MEVQTRPAAFQKQWPQPSVYNDEGKTLKPNLMNINQLWLIIDACFFVFAKRHPIAALAPVSHQFLIAGFIMLLPFFFETIMLQPN